MAEEKDTEKTQEKDALEGQQAKRRYNLALIIVVPCLIILVVTAIVLTCCGGLDPNTIFTAIIGLVGTWVGTILAFYYSKDNFEAASKSTDLLIQKVTSTQEKLKTTIAKAVMLTMNTFNKYDLKTDESKVKLSEIKEEFKGYNRLPILTAEHLPKYVIHESVLNHFVSDFFTGKFDGSLTKDATTREADFLKLTLDKFLGIESIKTKITHGFVTAKQEDNLDSIKKKMEAVKIAQCSDVFITADGTANSKVVGWLTNVIILENSKV